MHHVARLDQRCAPLVAKGSSQPVVFRRRGARAIGAPDQMSRACMPARRLTKLPTIGLSMHIFMRAVTVLLFSVLSCACTLASAQVRGESAPVGEFVLGPGDVINVSVWKQPALSVILPVAPDGSINY